MRRDFEHSTFLTVLLVLLAGKLAWDIVVIVQEWPKYPKLGIAIVLPVLMWGLLCGKQWALNLFGVVCLFWITYVAAVPIQHFLALGSEDIAPFPWSNLIAFPALVFVVNNLRTDEELRASRGASQ